MKKVEVEIWVNQFIGFFDKNPEQLIQLIGGADKDIFFEKVSQRCTKNLEEGDEVSLTQKQLIEIIVSLTKESKININITDIDKFFQKTSLGKICLN